MILNVIYYIVLDYIFLSFPLLYVYFDAPCLYLSVKLAHCLYVPLLISGPIGDVLSWPGWAPLSKLTYAAYLIHPLVQYLDWRNRFTLIYYDDLSMVRLIIGIIY